MRVTVVFLYVCLSACLSVVTYYRTLGNNDFIGICVQHLCGNLRVTRETQVNTALCKINTTAPLSDSACVMLCGNIKSYTKGENGMLPTDTDRAGESWICAASSTLAYLGLLGIVIHMNVVVNNYNPSVMKAMDMQYV